MEAPTTAAPQSDQHRKEANIHQARATHGGSDNRQGKLGSPIHRSSDGGGDAEQAADSRKDKMKTTSGQDQRIEDEKRGLRLRLMIEDSRRANLDEARIERKDNLKLLPS